MEFGLRWRLRQAHGRVFVEVALHGAAAVDGDFVAHQVAEPFDHRSLHFIECTAGIDDLAADVAGHPYFVDANFVARREMDFDDFRKMSAVAEMEGHAHGGVFSGRARAPSRSLCDSFE